MAKIKLKFSEEIRQAVEACGLTRTEICEAVGFNKGVLSRFITETGWLGKKNMDALAELIDLHVATGKHSRKKG